MSGFVRELWLLTILLTFTLNGAETKTVLSTIVYDSGSLAGNELAFINGLNAFLGGMKLIHSDVKYYSIIYSDTFRPDDQSFLFKTLPIFAESVYFPSSMYTVFDAITTGINILEQNVNFDDRVICIILSDQLEISGEDDKEPSVCDLIDKLQSTGNWTFLYIGEKSEQFAGNMGIPQANAVEFKFHDAASGLGALFETRANLWTVVEETLQTVYQEKNSSFVDLINPFSGFIQNASAVAFGVIVMLFLFKYYGEIFAFTILIYLFRLALFRTLIALQNGGLLEQLTTSALLGLALMAMVNFIYNNYWWIAALVVVLFAAIVLVNHEELLKLHIF